jgi:oxygen-independent coproporphyrinogen-3 oxidase
LKDSGQRTADGGPLSLYLHIPFCRRRCTYCDFNTYADLEHLFTPYVAALAKEVRRAPGTHLHCHPQGGQAHVARQGKRGRGERVATIFFGGGTPSILPLPLVADLLAACRDAFAVDADAEISLEANPGTVDEAKLTELRRLGVNRLSFGVQSAHPGELALLGRLHSFNQAVQAVALARASGFDNLSLDLIYGLPHQSLEDWGATLEAALALSPDHLSAYCLTVEEGTPLADWVATGQVAEPDPDLAAEMYELAEVTLGQAGFTHYEISNWARPGFECRHNLVYWRNGAYLGFGAGAHSHRDGRRWWNASAPAEYIARLQAGKAPEAGSEEIGAALAMGETMMLGLRLREGVSAEAFRERFGRSLDEVYGRELDELAAGGLIEWDGQRARLTAHGRLLGNQVFMRFLP